MDKTRENFDTVFDATRYQALLDSGQRRLSYAAFVSALMIHLYRDEPMFHTPFRVLTGLVAIDEKLTLWRYRHALMVNRMIGSKIGTGGSSGQDYLRRTVEAHRIFTDYFNLSTYLVPRSMLPPCPRRCSGSWGSTGMQLKSHFSEFFRGSGDWLHCTAHSHHPWPDVTRAAQLAYWDDAVRLTDRKWDKVFGEVCPKRSGISPVICILPQADQIVFAPNTHEFVVRLYSCLDWSRRQRVLTTAHEFHSFARQTRRLEETGRLEVIRVAAEPYETFADRFCDRLNESCGPRLVVAGVFRFGFSGRDLERIVRACPADALVVVDGYHAFGLSQSIWPQSPSVRSTLRGATST